VRGSDAAVLFLFLDGPPDPGQTIVWAGTAAGVNTVLPLSITLDGVIMNVSLPGVPLTVPPALTLPRLCDADTWPGRF
jgi:hypothetical protein